MNTATTDRGTTLALWQGWADLWNGDLSQAEQIVAGDLVCGRWHLQGEYAGGMPGATAAPGSRVDFHGTDILRVAGGVFAEYWLNSDVHVMAAQLGMTA